MEIIRRVAAHEEENEKKERNYTYVKHEVEKKLGDKGDVKSTETRTYDVMVIYGEQVERLVAKDDKPLPPKDAAEEEQKINKLIEKYKDETEDQRKRRLEKAEKNKEEDRAFIKDLPGSVKDAAICNVVLSLASHLQLSTIAEGVENEQQLQYLASQGC